MPRSSTPFTLRAKVSPSAEAPVDQLQGVLDWVQRWPLLTLAVLALACAIESVLVLGALVPTTVVLFAAGALVAFGAFEFWPVVATATLGAMAGDYLNFWIGRRYGERMLESHWAQRNVSAIERSRRIMQGNEIKGLFIGRWFGLVRPFIGALAGAHGMSLPRFLLIELAACVSWAGSLIFIGLVFSASLALAAEVATRLTILIAALLALIWFGFWLSHYAMRALQRRAEDWLHALLDWSHRHRRLGRMGEALADPAQPETPGLAIAAGLILLIGIVGLALAWGLGWREYPSTLDALVYQTFQNLQTPWATALAVALAQLGEWPVYLPVAAAVALGLGFKRRRAAAHWLAAVGFAAVIALGLYAVPTFSTPLEFYRGELRAHFSGRELILSTVIYGFFPVLLATGRSAPQRAAIYGVAISLLLLIVTAELYLGAQWLSLALFAAVLGALWIAALGLGYRRHGAEPVALARVLPLTVVAFVAASTVHWSLGFAPRLDAAQPQWTLTAIPAKVWWHNGWQQLPSQRVDMTGREKTSFNLQWAGSLKDIETALAAGGWRRPVPLTSSNALNWLAPTASIAELPLLPQVHAGRHQTLMLRKALADDRQALIQLWPSSWRLKDGERIWVGTVTEQRVRTLTRLFRYPVNDPRLAQSLGALLKDARGFKLKEVERDGPLWLLQPHLPDDGILENPDE